MRVIPPIKITDLILQDSSAVEPGVGETAWSAVTTYDEGDTAILGAPSSTVTITIASPGVVSWAENGLPNGTKVYLTTTGALPTGLAVDTIYYVIRRAAGTFQLSETLDGAPITTTGSQSGTHTAHAQIHRIYESVVGSNLDNPPAIDAGNFWIDVGPTNRWGMLDLLRNTKTWADSPLVVEIAPGQRINAIALLGLVADEVEITLESGSVVYSADIDLVSREVLSWYDYFFEEFDTKPSVVLFDLPPYSGATLTVTITRASGQVGCGSLVIGNYVDLGTASAGARADAINFSVIDRDAFGNAVLIPRRSVPRAEMRILCAKSAVKKIADTRTALNAEPAVWAALEEDDEGFFEPLLILGIYRKFPINADHPDHGFIELEVEEI